MKIVDESINRPIFYAVLGDFVLFCIHSNIFNQDNKNQINTVETKSDLHPGPDSLS